MTLSDARLRELVAALECPGPDEVKAMVEEIVKLRGLLRDAWPYVTEQYAHHAKKGPNAAARLHDRIYCALPSLEPDLLASRPCHHWHDTQQAECETCRKENGR